MSKLFKGPLGKAIASNRIGVPTLQDLQAFDHKSNDWIVGYLQLCEGILHSEVTEKSYTRELCQLLDHLYARKV